MPTIIAFSGQEGDQIAVEDEPHEVQTQLQAGRGTFVRFKGRKGREVFVNAERVAYFRAAPSRSGVAAFA